MTTSKAYSKPGPQSGRAHQPPESGNEPRISAPAPQIEAQHPRAHDDLVDFLYAQSRRGRLTPTICFLICSPVFLAYAPWWSLGLILAAQLGGTGICELLRRGYARLKPDESRSRYALAYAVASGICGLSWGMAGAFWYVPGEPELQMLLMALLMGGVTGSLIARSPYLPSLYAFVFAAGAPFVVVLLIDGTTHSMLVASLTLIFGAGIFGWGRGLNRMYLREASARLNNSDLVNDIEHARQEAERRAVEASIAQQAAEAGARAKTQFLSTISHEVRTPLNGILGMADLMRESQLTEDQLSSLSVIRESANNLRLILEDVLDLARLDAGLGSSSKDAFAPDKIALQVAAIVEPEIKRKNLELDIVVLPGVPSRITGDEKRCRQALLNIIGNAIKFTEEGKIAIRVSLEEDTPVAGVQVLRFAVRDTGIGIEPEAMAHLFDDFFQADQSSTRRHGGGGLGLALVKRVVTQMGGDVGVRSTPGEGSEFWFDVPLDTKAADHVPPVDTQPVSTGSRPGIIDHSRLSGLDAAIGPAKTLNIIKSAMEAAAELVRTMESGIRTGNAETVSRAAHDLKSTAGNVGLTALHRLAGRIEAAGRAGDDTLTLREAEDVPEAFADARAQLAVLYPQLDETRKAS